MTDNNTLRCDWKSFEEKFEKVFGVQYSTLETFINQVDKCAFDITWRKLTDWEKLDDIELLSIAMNAITFSSVVYIIPESSYLEHESPFRVESKEIENFVGQFLVHHHECLFNGDLAIVDLINEKIFAFHHEGVYGVFERNSVTR
jgi:hypothetical protein